MRADRADTFGMRTRNGSTMRAVSLILLLLLISACGDDSDTCVPNAYGGGGERAQNFSSLSFSSFDRFSEVRYDSLGAGFLGPPLNITSRQLAVVTTDRRLALLQYGNVRWTFTFPDGNHPLPELASDSLGTIYATTTEGKLFAVDSSGKLKWQTLLRTPEDSSEFSLPLYPLVVPGGIVCGMTSGSLRRFDLQGDERWSKQFSTGICRGIAFHDKSGIALGLTFNDYNRRDTLLLLDTEGESRGSSSLSGRIESGPLFAGEQVIIGGAGRGEDGKYRPFLTAFSSIGKQEWEQSLPVIPTAIAGDNQGNLYVCGGGGGRMSGGITISFDPDGKKRWEIGLRQSVPSFPVIAGNFLIFLGSQDQTLGAFIYGLDGTFYDFAPVESIARITYPPTLLPSGTFVISCSSEPIMLQNGGGGILGF